MKNFFRNRSSSTTTIAVVLALTVVFQGAISYSMTFGRLTELISIQNERGVQLTWIMIRSVFVIVVGVLWVVNRKELLFKSIIVANSLLTVALLTSSLALIDLLVNVSSKLVGILMGDVVFMAISNVLVFSVWYWIIDPPGIDERQKVDEPWDFLFPQRGDSLLHYESWVPRYTDYLYLAFTTSLVFSPADTVPLTRRAKMLMLLQALISAATIVVIAGTAINNL